MVKWSEVVFMLEEIADSMTLGGRLAALVGLVAALLALVLRLREYRQSPPSRPGTRDEVPSPVATAVPMPAAPPKPNDEDAAAGEPPTVDPDPAPPESPEHMPESATPDPGEVRPGSLFKPYVPPGR